MWQWVDLFRHGLINSSIRKKMNHINSSLQPFNTLASLYKRTLIEKCSYSVCLVSNFSHLSDLWRGFNSSIPGTVINRCFTYIGFLWNVIQDHTSSATPHRCRSSDVASEFGQSIDREASVMEMVRRAPYLIALSVLQILSLPDVDMTLERALIWGIRLLVNVICLSSRYTSYNCLLNNWMKIYIRLWSGVYV